MATLQSSPSDSRQQSDSAAAGGTGNVGLEVDELRSALEQRGIDNPEAMLELAAPEAIRGAICWWDDRRRHCEVGPGLLALTIRGGGKPGYGEAGEAVAPLPSIGRRAAEDLWTRMLESLGPELPETVLAVWLEPLWPVSLNGSVLYLEAPTALRGWVARRFGARLTSAASDLADVDRIEFVTRKRAQQ